MGEAKRRKENDPNYGKVPQKQPKTRRRLRFDPKRITPTEMLIWAVLFGGTAAVFLGTYFWKS
ncbi:MAG: hypothetical protein AAF572_03930 [Cyanobacteria bacterium P01_B01_bin.77]